MPRFPILAAALTVALPVAHAQAAPAVEEAQAAVDMEVLVPSDPFARWDGTRWRVDAQVLLPFPAPLYAAKNFEIQAVGYDVRLVTSCSLGENLGPRRKEVDCTIDAAALSVAPWQKDVSQADKVLDDNVQRLEGLTVRLQAHADGRVTNLTLVGEQEWYRRTQVQYENLRQILWVAFAGFDMRLPAGGIEVGNTFHDKSSRLWWAPTMRTLPSQVNDGPLPTPVSDRSLSISQPYEAPSDFGGRTEFTASSQGEGVQAIETPLVTGASGATATNLDALLAPSAMGRGHVVNRVDRYKGNYILQFTGEGSVDIGRDQPIVYKGSVNGVGVISPYDAILTERVWTVELQPTASNIFAEGVAGWPMRLQGTLRRLGDEEQSVVGLSAVVSPPGDTPRKGLPAWPALVR